MKNLLYRIYIKLSKKIMWPFNIMRFKSFGKNSIIVKPDILLGTRNISIRENVSILHHARIEALAYYEGNEYTPEIIIGSNTGIGRLLHLESCNKVIIGHDVLMSENIYISDCSHGFNEKDINIGIQALNCREVYIGDYCFIGRNACILPGVKLGKQCIVGANAVVTSGEYPDYSVLAGVPAKIIRTIKFN